MRLIGRLSIVVVSALPVLLLGARHPYNNWDMLGYVAAAYHADGLRGQQLLERTYADVRQHVDAASYAELLAGNDPEYRRVVASDPSALEEQLPFYSIRVAYVASLRALKHLHVPYAAGTQLVAAGFALGCVVMLALICEQCGAPLWLLPLVVAGTGYVELAAISAPDSMACCLALFATWLFLRGHKLALALFAVLPLARTEYVLLACSTLGYLAARGGGAAALVALAASMVTYGLVALSPGTYAYATLFNFTFFATTPFPSRLVPSHAVRDYARIYYRLGAQLLLNAHAVVYALALGTWFRRRGVMILDRQLCGLLVFPLLFLGLRLLLFPLLRERFVAYSTSLVLIWLGSQLLGRDDVWSAKRRPV
jgi:hypothetical protein